MTWKDVEMKKYKREEEKRRAAGAFPIQRTWKSSRLALQVERRKREREREEEKKKVVVVFCISTRTR